MHALTDGAGVSQPAVSPSNGPGKCTRSLGALYLRVTIDEQNESKGRWVFKKK